MSWGDTYNRHKAKGMDQNDAAFRADQSDPMRKRRAEVENERLREALIHADLKIRSFPGADQSDVEFIRSALTQAPAPTLTGEVETPAPEKHLASVEIPGELEMFEGKLTKVVDASRTGWWRFHAHRDRDGYCDNPARGY